MRARPPRSPLDAACPYCAASQGVPCHFLGADGVHDADTQFTENGSHPSRYHAAGMMCADLCDDCPLFTTEITYEDADDDADDDDE